MTTFKFDLASFTNKCIDSFLSNTSDKSNALWSATPNVINCTCGRVITKKHISDHLSQDIHKEFATSNPINDSIIYINYEKFIKCNTCNVYINQFKFKSHSLPQCVFINKVNYKGKIECLCGAIFKDDVKYRAHLSLESHITGFNKYLEDFNPWA